MSVKHANGTKAGVGTDDMVGNVTEARNDLGNTVDALAAKTDDALDQGKAVARRRPVPLATAAAGVVTAVAVTTVTIIRRRRVKPTAKQRAINAWRGMRKRVKR